MKLILALMLSFLSFTSSFADTSQTRSFSFDESRMEYDISSILTEKSRLETRVDTVWTTCYRTDYRRQCRSTPSSCRQSCTPGRGCRRVCTPRRTICNNVPVRVPYSCRRNVTRTHEVFDHYVNTDVSVSFSVESANKTIDTSEVFNIRVTGERSSLNASSVRNYIVILDDKTEKVTWNGDTKNISTHYKVRLLDASVGVNALSGGIQNVKLRSGILSFTLGKGFNFDNFTQNIRIFKNRRVLSDILLLNRAIRKEDTLMTVNTDTTDVSIDIRQFGISLPSQMRIIVDAKFNAGGKQILNSQNFKLEAQTNWIFR